MKGLHLAAGVTCYPRDSRGTLISFAWRSSLIRRWTQAYDQYKFLGVLQVFHLYNLQGASSYGQGQFQLCTTVGELCLATNQLSSSYNQPGQRWTLLPKTIENEATYSFTFIFNIRSGMRRYSLFAQSIPISFCTLQRYDKDLRISVSAVKDVDNNRLTQGPDTGAYWQILNTTIENQYHILSKYSWAANYYLTVPDSGEGIVFLTNSTSTGDQILWTLQQTDYNGFKFVDDTAFRITNVASGCSLTVPVDQSDGNYIYCDRNRIDNYHLIRMLF